MVLIVDFILVCGIIITAIMLYLTLKSKNKSLSKKILFAIYTMSIAYIAGFYSELHGLEVFDFIFSVITEGMMFILGPLLLFYTKSLFTSKDKITKEEYLHFLPYILYWLVFYVPVLISLSLEKPIFGYLIPLENSNVLYWLESFFFIGYIIFSIMLFTNYKTILKANFSTLDLKNLDWSKRLFIGVLIVMLIDICTSIYDLFIDSSWSTGFITIIAYIIFLGYLVFYGTNGANVLIPESLLKNHDVTREDSSTEDQITTPKNNSSGSHLKNACPEEISALKLQLQHIMEFEKPYLDENLTLSALATMITTNDKKLSALLNQHLNTTFYDLINQYRVESVKQKLQSDTYNNNTLISIAYECGFKSKSSFNRIFRKETGFSPSEFKSKISESL